MNITKQDVLELRRRLSKRECTISRMSGCYVNANRDIVLRFNQPFLDLEEEEFYKYLEIAKKLLSGTLGNNLLELNFAHGEDAAARQQFLLTLKGSKLQNEALLDRFYEQVIAQYDSPGHYLILVFHDVYDVMRRTRDNAEIDESEEIYEYLLCAVCPVDLSKPGLGYQEDENRIGVCSRDWVVGLPEAGFTYPAFVQRGSDVNAVLYYMKNGTHSHPELAEGVLGCEMQRTAAQDKQLFQDIVEQAFGAEEEQAENAFLKIQRNLDGLAAEQAAASDEQPAPPLTVALVEDVMADVDMPDQTRAQITRSYAEAFGDDLPSAGRLLDPKLAKEGAQRAHTLELERRVTSLQEQLAQHARDAQDAAPWADTADFQVAVRVPEARCGAVRTQRIDGRRCLLIPLDEGEQATVNGAPLED